MKRRKERRLLGILALYILIVFSTVVTANIGMTAESLDQCSLIPGNSKGFLLVYVIANLYDLSENQAVLLMAIREHEAGRPGKEFGVADNQPKHPARRWTDGKRSLCIQACYAAATIKKRCPRVNPAAVKRFGCGYFMPNGSWYPGYSEDPRWHEKVLAKLNPYNLQYDPEELK